MSPTRRRLRIRRALSAITCLSICAGCDVGTKPTATQTSTNNTVPSTEVRSATNPPTAPVPVARGGTITGRVRLAGSPPSPQPIKMDASCGALHKAPVVDSPYRVGADNGLAYTFVYIKNAPANRKFEPPAEAPLLDQEGCLYKPPLLVVWAGQKFKVRNSDGLIHNVHATPVKNREFNVGQPLKGQVTEKVFTEPEILLRIKCDFHPWMTAHMAVVDHPFHAVTDQDGQFQITTELPPGTYTVVAHHPKAGMVSQDLPLAAGESKKIELSLAVK